MRSSILLTVFAGALALAAGQSFGQATVYLSEVTTLGGGAALGNPNVDADVGDTISLGVWVSAPISLTVDSVALDLVESAGILTIDGHVIEEGGPLLTRWDTIVTGTNNASATDLLTGYDTVGGSGLSGGVFRIFDANYDEVADAFLYAVVHMTASGAGDANLFLKVGNGLIGYNTADTDIYFGSGDDPVDRSVAGAVSLIADATIHVLDCALGDVNGDGNVDNLDITPFIYAVANDEAAFDTEYPSGEYWAADCYEDGNVDNLDITAFLDILIGGEAVPEPITIGLLAAGGVAILLGRRRS